MSPQSPDEPRDGLGNQSSDPLKQGSNASAPTRLRVRVDQSMSVEMEASEAQLPAPRTSGDSNQMGAAGDQFNEAANIRRGSPFKESSAAEPNGGAKRGVPSSMTRQPGTAASADALMADHGVANAAPIAACLILPFAAISYGTFPAGGIFVSALGASLATMGCFSKRRWISLGLLATFVALFFGCYFGVV